MTRGNLVTVTFEWSDEHGECYDCGLPAAYYLYGRTRKPGVVYEPADIRCSVCAANLAADGETIRRIDEK